MYPDCTHLSDFQCQPLPPCPHRSTFSVVYIFIGAWSICSGLQGRMSFSNCMRARSHQLRSDKSDPNLFSLTASWPVLWATESQDQLSWEYKYEHGSGSCELWVSTWASMLNWAIDINSALCFTRITGMASGGYARHWCEHGTLRQEAQGYHQGITQWHRLHVST